jgi:heme A synthase
MPGGEAVGSRLLKRPSSGKVSGMDAGLVVVGAVLGVFLLVPLALAWVSTNPRRWARVERMLGREPKGSARLARWSMRLWFGVGAAYLVIGVFQVVSGQAGQLRWVSFVLGFLYLLNGFTQYAMYRGMRRRESAQTQVEDRAEPGRPGAGG